jgi:hypothetical protein
MVPLFAELDVRLLLWTLWLIVAPPRRPQEPWQVGAIRAAPGESRAGFLQVPGGGDGESVIPVTLVHGARAGPTLALVAGNHGYEYTPILAAQRLARSIDPAKLRGRVVLVHVANVPSYLKRTIYYSPVDGKNLNRVYPGRADGTLSERIAFVVTRDVIERADYLVDLHCGDGNESLRPYAYWMPIGDARVDEPSRAMAIAFGMERIVVDRGRPKDPAASLYCSNTAMTRGKPAITVESGGMGRAYDEESIARLERGVSNLLRHLGMAEGKPQPSNPRWLDPAEVLRFPDNLAAREGVFFPKAARGASVAKGALLGEVTDYFGKRIYELRAPFAGEVLYILGTPPISAGEPLAFIGAPK